MRLLLLVLVHFVRESTPNCYHHRHNLFRGSSVNFCNQGVPVCTDEFVHNLALPARTHADGHTSSQGTPSLPVTATRRGHALDQFECRQ